MPTHVPPDEPAVQALPMTVGHDRQATRVIAIRHGETAWNVDARIQGQLDIPLNATGRWQAQRLAQALAEDGIDAVYSSDLLRALHTARALAEVCGLTVATDTGLRERGFGVYEGLTHAEIGQRWPDQAARWRRREPDFAADGGETLHEFYPRSIAAVARLAARHPDQTIAIVSHGGVMDCLYRAALRLPLDAPRTWRIGNATINRLLYTPQGLALVGWSDDRHLEADGASDEFIDAEAGAESHADAVAGPAGLPRRTP